MHQTKDMGPEKLRPVGSWSLLPGSSDEATLAGYDERVRAPQTSALWPRGEIPFCGGGRISLTPLALLVPWNGKS